MELYYQTKTISIAEVDYQVKLSDEVIDPKWDEFVASMPLGHHVQTSLWGQVKSTLGYHAMRLIVAKNGRILAGGQFLIRKLMSFISIAYMPKGPVFSTWDPSLVQIVIDEIKRAAHKNRFLLTALQPASYEQEFKVALPNNGFRQSWLELAPTATILIDMAQDTDQILKKMKRQTRQNINRSKREGIITREGTDADLPVFYQLHVTTSQRQGFTPYPEEYFARMWQVFSKQGLIGLILSEYQNTAVSALLLVAFGNTVIPKTLGWSGEHGKRRPNDAVFWGAIQWAKKQGYRFFDMEGIDRRGAELTLSGEHLPEELKHTPDFFKLGYGGKVTLMPQSYFFVPNPLWRWPCQQIFDMEGRGKAFQENFERYRRRFG